MLIIIETINTDATATINSCIKSSLLSLHTIITFIYIWYNSPLKDKFHVFSVAIRILNVTI